jgi:hypothetical protein
VAGRFFGKGSVARLLILASACRSRRASCDGMMKKRTIVVVSTILTLLIWVGCYISPYTPLNRTETLVVAALSVGFVKAIDSVIAYFRRCKPPKDSTESKGHGRRRS